MLCHVSAVTRAMEGLLSMQAQQLVAADLAM